MSFSVYDRNIALCSNERVILFDVVDNTRHEIVLPALESDKKIDIHNNIEVDTFHFITTILFSNDGKYFLVCTNRKQLCLFDRRTKELVSNRTLIRAASKVKFTPNNDIIVADKAGDAYIYSTREPSKPGTCLLGHLSMLLDVLMTNDEKYILTADRDEKIRISMYPNCYNIWMYCLGHTKFVTNISFFPTNNDILVSAGGDGNFKLWDFKSGRELCSVNFCDKLNQEELIKFNDCLNQSNLDEIVDVLPVKHMRLSEISKTSCLLILTLYGSKTILIYKIKTIYENNFDVTYVASLTIENESLDCHLKGNKLWILTESGIYIYENIDGEIEQNSKWNSKLVGLNNFWSKHKSSTVKQDFFPLLYKRKFDNVQEYLGRKKLRLDKATKQTPINRN